MWTAPTWKERERDGEPRNESVRRRTSRESLINEVELEERRIIGGRVFGYRIFMAIRVPLLFVFSRISSYRDSFLFSRGEYGRSGINARETGTQT